MNDRSVQVPHRSASPVDPAPGWLDLLSAASDPRRLAILTVLRERGPLRLRELTARVEARDDPAGRDSRYDVSLATLHHVHLPRLVEVDLVEVGEADDGEDEWVRPGPAFEPATIEALRRDVESGAVDDATVAALDDPRRRRAVSTLAAADGPVELDELVQAVVERSPRPGRPEEPAPDAAVLLHHVDLPKLAAAGIVDYDYSDGRRVTYLGLPDGLEPAVRSA